MKNDMMNWHEHEQESSTTYRSVVTGPRCEFFKMKDCKNTRAYDVLVSLMDAPGVDFFLIRRFSPFLIMASMPHTRLLFLFGNPAARIHAARHTMPSSSGNRYWKIGFPLPSSTRNSLSFANRNSFSPSDPSVQKEKTHRHKNTVFQGASTCFKKNGLLEKLRATPGGSYAVSELTQGV